ncbi:uncharacterized protein LOC134228420 [Saccostrea cucullata]|uniref:uncharacterized protein LOC134228420 n=1 Tax=Saccostrea cuccullata TaxID=36930 RepID=UPI002ED0673C
MMRWDTNQNLLYCIVLTSVMLICQGQSWWSSPANGPTCKANTCRETDSECECSLTIDHRLTMMTPLPGAVLVTPNNGKLVYTNDTELSDEDEDNVITADGVGSRLVIAVNGRFPGPTIEAYENQNMIIHVRNLMHTESTTVHWHGMHQRGTPHYDGVAFISQCPILPGQTFTYRFTASPYGSSFYHAHIGDQRSMGLYGGLIIYPRSQTVSQPQQGFTVLLQDWNHDDEPETLYQRMLNGVYDIPNRVLLPTTQSIDGANFSRFQFHSGLINGKGRYYSTPNSNNGAPLEIFEVEQGRTYRFRVISAATLYPFRVFVEGHPEISVCASDGFEIAQGTGANKRDINVESFIIHPGERYDFFLNASQTPRTYRLVAESIEVLNPAQDYHAAEALIIYRGSTDPYPPYRAASNPCPCITFNCPYMYYPSSTQRTCLPYDSATSNEPSYDSSSLETVSETMFFNFAFPGEQGQTPGSVNGHQFLYPTAPILVRSSGVEVPCSSVNCGDDSICECTYSVNLSAGKVYQFVLTNIGGGRGWSHPVHLHGHYFFVYKIGFGSYDPTSASFVDQTSDIICQGTRNYCNSANWRDTTWRSNARLISDLKLDNPPAKDTIIVPTGGYVVIRFKADNPGAWFFHCHIDVHNTNGMGMVLLESSNQYPATPANFPTCWEAEAQNSSLGNIKTDLEYIIGVMSALIIIRVFVH